MIDEAGYWWGRQEANLITWEQAKEAVLKMYGDRNKQRNSVTKIKNLQQGSRTISALFIEVDTLNIYTQLDPETLPNFLEAGLNGDLRMQMELMNNMQPLNSYIEWKEKALDLGSKLEANKKRHAAPRTRKIVPTHGGNTSNSNPPISTTKNSKKSKPTQKLVPQDEKDRRMAAGECIKYGRPGHMGKECRTGWKYEPSTSSTEPTPTQVSKLWKDARELGVIIRVIERAKRANRMEASRQ